MIDVVLFPALLGALISVVWCGIRRSRKERQTFTLAFVIAFLIGVGFLLEAFGLSFFTSGFWTHNEVADPVLLYVLIVFGLFAFAGLIPSVLVIISYRIKWHR
jgi:hypothetical protein